MVYKYAEYKKKYYLNHKEEMDNYMKEWRKKHPKYLRKDYQKYKKIIHELKINGCAICGYNKCDAALEFHHVNPEDKEFGITAWSVARKNFSIELNKCILLCANCHLENQ